MIPWKVAMVRAVMALGCWNVVIAGATAFGQPGAAIPLSVKGAPETVPAPAGIAPIELRQVPEDPCSLSNATATPMRPNWSTGAATTQCGVLEMDFGWTRQPMGQGVNQSLQLASARFGLTPRMDLRWGLPGHVTQTGGAESPLDGITDQWLSARYRFHDQGSTLPALAFCYGIKIPTADPRKGFGSGYLDQQLTFILSRDLGHVHLDFNTVGTVARSPRGHDGAAQFGLALTFQATRRMSWILESDGGPQPGVPDRYGAALIGAAWIMRPWLVLDSAYTRAYTAGTPREQFTVGFTCSRHTGVLPLPANSKFARLLGR